MLRGYSLHRMTFSGASDLDAVRCASAVSSSTSHGTDMRGVLVARAGSSVASPGPRLRMLLGGPGGGGVALGSVISFVGGCMTCQSRS